MPKWPLEKPKGIDQLNINHNQIDGAIAPPTSVRLEACTLCQLQCPLCPGALEGKYRSIAGKGYLPAESFRTFVDNNPHIRRIELSSQGEVFLNPDLPKILGYAHARNIMTTINNGANLNHAADDALEALVKFKTAVVRCAVDGVTQETYAAYRVGGKLKNVLANIQKINAYKEKYRSSKPHLIFQFIVFGHNEHEMEQAMLLSKMLKMSFSFRLNRVPGFMPVKNRDRMRKLIGYADRGEYLEELERNYIKNACLMLWKFPQINWDGKLLGCPCNKWGFYAENVFEDNLAACLNNEKMRYTRQMLMGKKQPRDDTLCMKCAGYASLKRYDKWVTKTEVKSYSPEFILRTINK